MKLAEYAIERPVTTVMFVLAVMVFGAVAYRNIGVDYFPDVDIPYVTVMTVYEGASPESVETDVTEIIEEAVSTISGIKKVRSTSYEGLSMVTIEFELTEDVDVVSQDVRDKVAKARQDLPLTIEEPIIEKLDLTATPVIYLALYGDASIAELTLYADEVIKRRLESVQGVGRIEIYGGRERNVRIWLDMNQLKMHNLTPRDVMMAVQRDNVEPPGGRVETGPNEVIVKTMGRMPTVDDFKNLIVKVDNGAQIKLSDVAHIEDGTEDARSFTEWNGRNSVAFSIQRQGGKNTVEVANNVMKRVAEVQEEMQNSEEAKQYNLEVVDDLSSFIKTSVDEANGELVRGAILTVLVIYFFLRTIRGSIVAAIVIPASIIGTYSVMSAMDITLNMMSLLGLTVSVGLVVDDAIVVLENAYRHIEEGKTPLQAAYAAMAEIGFAVIAVSLATLAVFLPVAFMGGIVGKFFYQFAITVSVAIALSTIFALTLSPMMCGRMLSHTKKTGIVFVMIERLLVEIESFYRVCLHGAMRMRWVIVGFAVLVFVSSYWVIQFVGSEFIPESDQGKFIVNIKTPVSSSLESTIDVTQEVKRRLLEIPDAEVQSIYLMVGANQQEAVNQSSLLVYIKHKSDRVLSQFDIEKLARASVAEMTKEGSDLEISISPFDMMGGGGDADSPMVLNLQGLDITTLGETAEELLTELKEVPGIADLRTSYDAGKPEANVIIDKEKANDLGISTSDIGETVQLMVAGRPISTFEQGGRTYDVRIRAKLDDRKRVDQLLEMPLRTRTGEIVELRTVANVIERSGPVQIDRENRSRQIAIYAGYERDKTTLAEVQAEFTKIVDNFGLAKRDIRYSYGGEAERMQESFGYMVFTLILAIVLIYMVLAAQFESLAHPFTVMISMPLSVVGALGALAITGRTLSIFSMIGMIMLMGLVTKNAILLIDYANELRKKGWNRDDAILEAGPVRLRPILMTAIATVAGMIPVAIGAGDGGETRSPMGTAIIGGMVTSTLLTLIVIPVVYTLVDDFVILMGRVFGFSTEMINYEQVKAELHEIQARELAEYKESASNPKSIDNNLSNKNS